MIVLKLLATVWGACLASFINTIIWRLLNQISLFDPQRSYCNSCHQQLTWWQLIPVIGWLIQKVGVIFVMHLSAVTQHLVSS